MYIDLTTEDAVVLRDMLSNHLGWMSMEIAASDNPVHRRSLRQRRDILAGVRDQLTPAAGDR